MVILTSFPLSLDDQIDVIEIFEGLMQQAVTGDETRHRKMVTMPRSDPHSETA